MKKIYLASPFFNEKEIERMSKVRDILRAKGLDVFCPNEHQSPELEFGSLEWREKTFKNDVDHIDWCDVVVAVVSQGNYDDSGTCWELGFAHATNKKVILVNVEGNSINLMIANSLHAIITSYDELSDYDFDELKPIPYLEYVW